MIFIVVDFVYSVFLYSVTLDLKSTTRTKQQIVINIKYLIIEILFSHSIHPLLTSWNHV